MFESEMFFRETSEAFTVYVVEQRFVNGRGHDYFSSFKNKDNYISSEREIKRNISKVLGWIQKATPAVAELVKSSLNISSPLSIIEIITSLSKLFTVNEHNAVGPEVLDPIIIQEGTINRKYLAQLIALHKDSILQPAIIILLQDNDFERAKDLLCKCPHGMNVKMIRNNGEATIYKTINTGAGNVEDFIDAFSRQCFSTCSNTKRNILMNEDWAEHSLVRLYSPSMFKIRTNLVLDEKEDAKEDIDFILDNLIETETGRSINEDKLLLSFICMAKLFKVYCADAGGQDIYDALDIAKDQNNDLLLAHVYRYSFFLKDYSLQQRLDMLDYAVGIFKQNNVQDHAIYCRNNILNQQMYNERVTLGPYKELLDEAIYNVPGLAGMSYIYNNTGVAYIYSGRAGEAVELFEKGLNYSRDRIVPWLALQSNILIAKKLSFDTVKREGILYLLNQVFDTMGVYKLPFISANIVTNCLNIAFEISNDFGQQVLVNYPINQLYCNALIPNQMGSGSLYSQFQFLAKKYPALDIGIAAFPRDRSYIGGTRLRYIDKYGLNPVIFHTWL